MKSFHFKIQLAIPLVLREQGETVAGPGHLRNVVTKVTGKVQSLLFIMAFS